MYLVGLLSVLPPLVDTPVSLGRIGTLF
jgi:hypothetical protein